MYSPEGIRTEILLRDRTWLDISSNVRGEGAGEGIRITAGRKNERTRTNLSASFTISDPDGYFNDQNPRSPYFGLIGRNTQCRVQCGNQAALIDDFNRSVTDNWNTVRYSFDSTSEGWVGEGSTSVTRVTTAANVHDGAGSLQATKTMGSGFDSLRFNDASGLADDISAAGNTISIWAKVPTGAAGGNWRAHIEVQDSTFTWIPTADTRMVPGTWHRLTYVDPGGLFANCRAVGVQFSAEGVNGSQSVHIDTVWQYDSVDQEVFWVNTTSAGSTPADFDVNGTHGTHTNPTENVLHYSTVDTGEKNHRVRARFKLSAGTLTGANASVWMLGRFTDISNYYACIVSMSTAGNVQMQLQKRVGGVLSPISDAITTHSGYSGLFNSVEFITELYIENHRLMCKMWDETNFDEPDGWQIIDEDFSLTTGNFAGVADRREGGNTNANLQAQYNEFMAVPGTIRGHFEIPNFGALEWQEGGNDLKQTIQATGLKRRLGAKNAPVLKSAVYREITSLPTTNIVGYWPMEDGANTTQIGSGISGRVPLNVVGGSAQFGVSSDLPGVASMVGLQTGVALRANVLQSTDTGVIRAILMCQFPDAGTLVDNACIMEIAQVKDVNIRKWRLVYGTGGSLKLFGYSHGGTLVHDSGPFSFGVDGSACLVQFDVVQNGANVDWAIRQNEIRQDGSGELTGASGTFNTTTVGAISGAAIGPSGELNGLSVSHFVLVNSTGILSSLETPMIGHYGETAAERFVRLCTEEGVSYQIIGEAGSSTAARMGAQRIATLLQNLEDIEDTEHGIIIEARHFFGLVFRQHQTLYNQMDSTAGPSLDYTQHISGEPFPVPDDLEVANDVTVTRFLGSEARSVEEDTDHPMNVNEFPDGIGRYDLRLDTYAMQDSQLPDMARWNRHIGTWEGPRYPNIELQMHRNAIANSTGITSQIAGMIIGDYFSISNPPDWLPPEEIELLSQGYSEVIRNTHWTITHNTVPAQPYRIAVRESNVGGEPCVHDALDSEVDANFTVGSTSLAVQVNVNPAWVTGAVDFDIMVAGVRLHVTNIGAVVGNVQTFTVDATPVNGISKTIPAGTPVHVYPQSRRGLQKLAGNVANISDFATQVIGVDTPPTQWVEGEGTGVFTNSSFASDSIPVGVIFTAPSSGRVMLTYAGRIQNDTGGSETLMGVIIRIGSVLGNGSTHEAAADGRCLRVVGTDHKFISMTRMITGLTAGRDYNVVFVHRRSAGNAQVNERFMLVRPDRTQGGRPGQQIEEVPASATNTQGASDTSTSTTYTTTDMTSCGVSFVAPASGKVLVHLSAQMDNSGANTTFVSYRIGTGSTLGAGTEIVAPSDARGISLLNINNLQCGATVPVTGLTPGDTYNAQLMHRVTAGTGTLVDRNIVVEPVF